MKQYPPKNEIDQILTAKKEYTCPITNSLFVDPVILVGDGFIYEKKAIEKWIRIKKTSPMTNKILVDISLIPCHTMKSLVDEYKSNSIKQCLKYSKELISTNKINEKLVINLLKRVLSFNDQNYFSEVYDLYDEVNVLNDMKKLLNEKEKEINTLKLEVTQLKRHINQIEGSNSKTISTGNKRSRQFQKNEDEKLFGITPLKRNKHININFEDEIW